MSTTVYFAGGEDCDLFQVGGGAVSTNAAAFRSGYARCGLQSHVPLNPPAYWQNWAPFSATTFWHGVRLYTDANNNSSGMRFMGWCDSSNVERLQILCTGTAATYKVMKVTGAGVSTQLGSNFVLTLSQGIVIDKLDVFIDYQVSGTFAVYLNGINYFTYSGDVTTDSATAMAYVRHGGFYLNALSHNVIWSEIVVSNLDTRSWSLQTLPPVANGNTHNFDTGTPAASNVNEITRSDATTDGSTTAGQIDQYTIPAAIAGTYTIMAIGVSGLAQKGTSGPTKMDEGVRSGTTDYWSSDKSLTTTWAGYQNWWVTDPNTSATWAALPINIGLKSVT